VPRAPVSDRRNATGAFDARVGIGLAIGRKGRCSRKPLPVRNPIRNGGVPTGVPPGSTVKRVTVGPRMDPLE
jgi:hypothetical protein